MFIHESDFSNRFMGAVTALLVLAALLASLGESLPKTAYFKFIDVWFNWFIMNIFVIILIHIIIDYYDKKNNGDDVGHMENNSVFKENLAKDSALFRKNLRSKDGDRKTSFHVTLNKICRRALVILNFLFVSIYFIATTLA